MSASSLGIEGAGTVRLEPGERCDPTALLASPKTRKYMSAQDEMAVVGAGRAIASAGLSGPLGTRTGLYLAVGYIPFDYEDVRRVVEASTDQGRFSLARFTREGWQRARPLVAFRCLPNMPAFHVSATFGIEGPCEVLYPGAGQLYLALEAAEDAIARGEIDRAVVGGVTHQRNFLVEQHFARVDPPRAPEELGDAAAFVVVSRSARAIVQRLGVTLDYRARDPRVEAATHLESFSIEPPLPRDEREIGPASLPDALAAAIARGGAFELHHRVEARDGITASSSWRRA